MATEDIGNLVKTQIPTLGSDADIQTALRVYHYGDESYNTSNSTPGNLPTLGIAKYIYDLRDDVDNLQTTQGIQESEITAKGDLLVGVSFENIGVLSLPTSPNPQGYVLSADSAATTGLKWIPVEVTASNAATLSNKTLTLPAIASGGGIVDTSVDARRYLTLTTVSAGINHINITNAATTNGPTIAATGTDTNIDLNLAGKGSGVVKVGGSEVVTLSASQTLGSKTLTTPVIAGTSSTSGQLGYTSNNLTFHDGTSSRVLVTTNTSQSLSNKILDSGTVSFSNGSRTITFTPSGNDVTLTAPTGSGTLVTAAGSASLTNKDLSSNTNLISIGTNATNSDSVSTGLISAFNLKANLAAATFTGTVTVPNNTSTRATGLIIGTARVYVGSTAPTGASSGDVWIRTA